jgi:hypothetical protein
MPGYCLGHPDDLSSSTICFTRRHSWRRNLSGLDKGTPYDHIWDLYNKGQDNHTYIEWSSTSGEGRVKDSNRFGDDNWHCWDGGRMNVACP